MFSKQNVFVANDVQSCPNGQYFFFVAVNLIIIISQIQHLRNDSFQITYLSRTNMTVSLKTQTLGHLFQDVTGITLRDMNAGHFVLVTPGKSLSK